MKIALKTVIVEDEINARSLLKSMLSEIAPFIEIVGEASGVDEGLDKINQIQPDLLILDVELTDGTAFDLLDQLKEYKGQLIFVTAYGHYALEAIKFCALDYLMKPISIIDLEMAVKRIVNESEKKISSYYQISELIKNFEIKKYNRKIAITSHENIRFVKVKHIIRCESEGNYTWIYTQKGDKIISTRILKDYESLLESNGFFRIHKQHLINLHLIKEYVKGDSGSVIMHNGDELMVSRRKRNEFLDAMEMI